MSIRRAGIGGTDKTHPIIRWLMTDARGGADQAIFLKLSRR